MPEIPDYEALHAWFVQNNYIDSTEETWLNGLWGVIEGLEDPDPDDVESGILAYCSLSGTPAPGSNLSNNLSILLYSNEFWGDWFEELTEEQEYAIAVIGVDAIGGWLGGVFGGAVASIIWVITVPPGG